ncbi:hypothetical protein [Paenibacillus mendelii]|uniref:Uncharacterized protein n=1 Tax=Paenibacillus mendelii TaxID=206163 RepID=A0ABV6JEY4_9BACL|nr:hypothetical protein [Paenibacillus mendelii]MCQ6557349.1 hypothetical protein [Paenibacillus mendelii]
MIEYSSQKIGPYEEDDRARCSNNKRDSKGLFDSMMNQHLIILGLGFTNRGEQSRDIMTVLVPDTIKLCVIKMG